MKHTDYETDQLLETYRPYPSAPHTPPQSTSISTLAQNVR